MKTKFKAFRSEEGSPIAEAEHALRLAQSTIGDVPHLLSYTPVGRTNPYQALLYSEAVSSGFAPAPIVDSWSFPKITRVSGVHDQRILHIHWTSFVLNGVKDRGVAQRRLDDFLGYLDSFTGRGGRILWTLHNVVPHDAVFMDIEFALQQELAGRSDVLHALSDASVDTLSQHFKVDRSKVVLSPHPHYKTSYERHIGRLEARLAFGLEPSDRVYVLLGALKEYKGLGRILEAFRMARAADPHTSRKLVVGGAPDDVPAVRQFVADCEADPDVLIEAKKIPANFVPYYMGVADVGLAPYSRMLNSGAILLYQSFGLPVVASAEPAIWESMTEDIAEKVAGDSAEELASALLASDRLIDPAVRSAVESYVDQFDPGMLSRGFFEDVSKQLAVRTSK